MLITRRRSNDGVPPEVSGRGSEEIVGQRAAHARGGVAANQVRGAHAVFGLIGASAASNSKPARAATGSDRAPAARDLIETLHDQYRRALDDPQASFADGWAAPAVAASETSADLAYGQSASAAAVEALLSGGRSLEHAFGPLVKDDTLDLAEPVPVPEILRLFASAEYHAAAARRSPVLPPALARREHQALGIDSPLVAPQCSPTPNPEEAV